MFFVFLFIFLLILNLYFLFKIKNEYDKKLIYIILILLIVLSVNYFYYSNNISRYIINIVILVIFFISFFIYKKELLKNEDTTKSLFNTSIIIIFSGILTSIIITYIGYVHSYEYVKYNAERNIYFIFDLINHKNIDKKEIINYWNNLKPFEKDNDIYILDKKNKIIFSSNIDDFINKKNLFLYDKYFNNYKIVISINKEIIREKSLKIILPLIVSILFISLIILPLGTLLLKIVYSIQENKINAKNKDLIIISKNLEESLKQKELLLKEIHHRVKNNLQVVFSLIGLQINSINDENTINNLLEIQKRIKSMSIIHEKLYQTNDLYKVNFKEYIEELSKYIINSYNLNTKVNLELDLEEHFIPIDKSIPCGLIINEIISNSLKHSKCDKIKIYFKKEEDNYILQINDNGHGINNIQDIQKYNSLGLKLVNKLSRQLSSNIVYKNNNGLCFKLIFTV
ncbi:MAG: hypothetical protein KatS3mg068_1317 [Candidatus Sericytochromatia bacterium]|nr:MAG: hypothetical protein KatS3mg068_1317 [Candidatus Sericytochromatia bacterium]